MRGKEYEDSYAMSLPEISDRSRSVSCNCLVDIAVATECKMVCARIKFLWSSAQQLDTGAKQASLGFGIFTGGTP